LPVTPSKSQILPLPVGDVSLCQQASDLLHEGHGIYVQQINFAIVSRGSERLRPRPSPKHDTAAMDRREAALVDLWTMLRLPR
jgi:7-keto-8-aminopelargonate synthetase-like enzyme